MLEEARLFVSRVISGKIPVNKDILGLSGSLSVFVDNVLLVNNTDYYINLGGKYIVFSDGLNFEDYKNKVFYLVNFPFIGNDTRSPQLMSDIEKNIYVNVNLMNKLIDRLER